MIGKHFKMRSFANPNVTRHYTVCNVMEPTYYTHMNNALNSNNPVEVQAHLDQS
jgi:hypothetical protein